MFKVLKNKLIIKLVAIITPISVIGISTFILNNANTTIEKMQDSNIKEKNMTEVLADDQNIQENNNQELNSVADAENSSNNDVNYQETTSSQLENSNNNYANNQKNSSNYSEINRQETTNFQPENLNNINDQQVASAQQKNETINTNTTSKAKISTIHYDRTTSIYENDNITLLRVEYYLNNKLTYYSVIEQFDATTKSYIEKIYKCNLETNIDPLVRTDIYVNGNLTKSY